MSGDRVQHGLIQKAKRDAEALAKTIRIDTDGKIWRIGAYGYWQDTGDRLRSPADRESFLVAQLSQEDR